MELGRRLGTQSTPDKRFPKKALLALLSGRRPPVCRRCGAGSLTLKNSASGWKRWRWAILMMSLRQMLWRRLEGGCGKRDDLPTWKPFFSRERSLLKDDGDDDQYLIKDVCWQLKLIRQSKITTCTCIWLHVLATPVNAPYHILIGLWITK